MATFVTPGAVLCERGSAQGGFVVQCGSAAMQPGRGWCFSHKSMFVLCIT